MYIYIYAWKPFVLCFASKRRSNHSNQNSRVIKGDSRYIICKPSVHRVCFQVRVFLFWEVLIVQNNTFRGKHHLMISWRTYFVCYVFFQGRHKPGKCCFDVVFLSILGRKCRFFGGCFYVHLISISNWGQYVSEPVVESAYNSAAGLGNFLGGGTVWMGWWDGFWRKAVIILNWLSAGWNHGSFTR